ncbi:MAG: hypothetical protein Q8O23_04070 [Gallionella sp.]|nr:hypothetical protein [Gallionella sp.]
MSLSLFEDYPVTEAEISAWLDTVTNLSALESRRQAYARMYDVTGKIRNQKRLASQAQKSNLPPL